MCKVAIIALVVLLPCWHSAVALDAALDVNQYAHAAWRTKEGFISSEINAIAQTTDGYLWLGTDSGLFRFDGVRTVPWVPPAGRSLPETHIRALLGTRDGTLWIGTWGGLVSWKDGKLTSYPQLAGWWINDLLEGHDGVVWAGSMSPELSVGRLCSVHMSSMHCDGDDRRFGRWVGSMHEDSNGQLWVASSVGLWQWNPRTPRLRSLPGELTEGLQGFADGEDGALLVTTRIGILRVAGATIELMSRGLPTVNHMVILRDRDGALWIGGDDRGLLHLHRGRLDAFGKSEGLAGARVARIFEDREGNLWVATDQGLNRFHDVTAKTYSVEQGLSALTIDSLLTTRGGDLWISTPNGLNRWKSGEISVYAQRHIPPQAGITRVLAVSGTDHSGLPDGEASLLEDTRGRIWVGSTKGLGYLENNRYVAVKGISGGYIDAITQDPGGTVWVAHRALGLLRISSGEVTQQIPWAQLGAQKEARRLAADPRPNSLWLGFLLGGVAHFVDGNTREFYSANDGLAAGRVHDLRLDTDGTAWVGAEGGLSRIRKGRIATLTSHSGLPCDAVGWTMRDDADALWIYTGCGIARIEPPELERWEADLASGGGSGIRATVVDSSQGVVNAAPPISSWSPHVAKSQDGRIWFATPTGLGVLDPHNLQINRLVPPVHIEQVTSDRKSYVPVSPLRLPAQLHDLEIDYTALSLVAPEKMLFRYKLEGRDRDWHEAGNRRRAFYSDLGPGNYRFRVIASNNSGVWNEQGDALAFSIAPAYWQTTWFRALCVAAFLGLLWLLYGLRLRQVKRTFNMTLEARVNERTRIARDLHDSLLQGVQGLMFRLQAVRELLPPGDAAKILDSAMQAGDQAIGEGRDAVQNLRSSSFDECDLATSLGALGTELEIGIDAVSKPEYRVVIEGSPRELTTVVRDDAYRIVREAVRNAYQHAKAGHIETEVTFGDVDLTIRVRDDGIGLDPQILASGQRAGHWGLRGMRERSESIGGRLRVWSEANAGTEIELRIPANVAYARRYPSTSSWIRRLFYSARRSRTNAGQSHSAD